MIRGRSAGRGRSACTSGVLRWALAALLELLSSPARAQSFGDDGDWFARKPETRAEWNLYSRLVIGRVAESTEHRGPDVSDDDPADLQLTLGGWHYGLLAGVYLTPWLGTHLALREFAGGDVDVGFGYWSVSVPEGSRFRELGFGGGVLFRVPEPRLWFSASLLVDRIRLRVPGEDPLSSGWGRCVVFQLGRELGITRWLDAGVSTGLSTHRISDAGSSWRGTGFSFDLTFTVH